jgi:energy-coupling factor transport system substrate-specific component
VPGRQGGILSRLGLPAAAAALLLLAFLSRDWGLAGLLLAAAVLALAWWFFEARTVSPRELSLVATLGTVAALARVPFAALPGVQPTTFLVITAGLVFGPAAGFMVGSTAALVSNFFLGQGPWTPFQMLAWGLAGATAGWLPHLRPNPGRAGLAAFGLAWGYLFGWLMNLWFWAAFLPAAGIKGFAAACAASLPFDTAHALTILGLLLLAGRRVVRILGRFRDRMRIQYGTAAQPQEGRLP